MQPKIFFFMILPLSSCLTVKDQTPCEDFIQAVDLCGQQLGESQGTEEIGLDFNDGDDTCSNYSEEDASVYECKLEILNNNTCSMMTMTQIVSDIGDCEEGSSSETSDADNSSNPEVEDTETSTGTSTETNTSTGDCEIYFIRDCDNTCSPESWLGDGACDDGSTEYYGYTANFNCADFNYDNGDCN